VVDSTSREEMTEDDLFSSISDDNESFQLDENDIPSSKGGKNGNKMLLDVTNTSHMAEAMCPITVLLIKCQSKLDIRGGKK
jgi:hypothetical protein